MSSPLEQAADLLGRTRSALFITGAGISAASGVPTYRGIGGLYGDRLTEEGVEIEEVLSGPMFQRRPELTWKYIHQIEQACRGARFNPAHAALAHLERHLDRCWVLTQNVDGFHRDAGSRNVIDIHGDLHRILCAACPHEERVADYAALSPCPRCPRCGAVLRPDVVLFGEMLPPEKLALLHKELARGFDVVVSIGTSSLFPYITQPVTLAATEGWGTLEINPDETSISRLVKVRLAMPAVEALTAILARIAAGTK
ncbi:NAD-dependent deacylase [Sorangium sp. So ce1036]|uniref:NAD-dependent deacylase n=1 Tax=Sorangium sp. So ce1036 TaxID=3133328 RepID=UPI003F01E65D